MKRLSKELFLSVLLVRGLQVRQSDSAPFFHADSYWLKSFPVSRRRVSIVRSKLASSSLSCCSCSPTLSQRWARLTNWIICLPPLSKDFPSTMLYNCSDMTNTVSETVPRSSFPSPFTFHLHGDNPKLAITWTQLTLPAPPAFTILFLYLTCLFFFFSASQTPTYYLGHDTNWLQVLGSVTFLF